MGIDDHHHGPAPGLMRWVTTTNHKDIGTLYLWFSLIMFFIGGGMALIIRAELGSPGLQFVDPMFFQFNDHHARHCHDLWRGYASVCWLGELDDSNDDWCA